MSAATSDKPRLARWLRQCMSFRTTPSTTTTHGSNGLHTPVDSAPANTHWPAVARRLLCLLDRHATWLSLSAALALVLALYGRALGFAFFFDEPLDLTRVERGSYWWLLSSSEGYQYYRPLPFLLWKLLHGVQGYYDHTLLHALTLVAHACCGCLLYLLLRGLGARHWGLLPALLFLTNPFHYQVVPMVSTVFHALAGAFVLASLNCYLAARQSERPARRRLYILSIVTATCALWTHESGVAMLPLVVALEGWFLWQRGSRRPTWWLAGHVAATVLFLLTWLSVDKAPNTEQAGLADLHPKLLFLLQGFTYPISAQSTWLDQHLGIAPGVLELGLCASVIGVGAYVVSARRTGQPRLLALPAIAAALALATYLPTLARLSWVYVQDSPRLLYLPAIGAALFWGMLPMLSLRDARTTQVWRAVALLLVLAIVVQSWRFIDIRMEMYARGSTLVEQLTAVGDAHAGQRLLVVNTPSWFAQDRYEYRYGHLGVPLMPVYVGLDGVIYANSPHATQVDARSVAWQPDVSGGVYPFGPHGVTAAPEELDALLREGRVLVSVAPRDDTFTTRDVGRLQPEAAEQLPGAQGRIDAGVWLDALRVAQTSSNPELLTLFITWQVLQPLDADVDTIIEVRGVRNQVVASYRGYALDGYSAPRLWQAGDRVSDSSAVPVPAEGAYSVWVGLQRVGSDARLAAADAAGATLEDGFVRIGGFVITAAGTLSLTAPPSTS